MESVCDRPDFAVRLQLFLSQQGLAVSMKPSDADFVGAICATLLTADFTRAHLLLAPVVLL